MDDSTRAKKPPLPSRPTGPDNLHSPRTQSTNQNEPALDPPTDPAEDTLDQIVSALESSKQKKKKTELPPDLLIEEPTGFLKKIRGNWVTWGVLFATALAFAIYWYETRPNHDEDDAEQEQTKSAPPSKATLKRPTPKQGFPAIRNNFTQPQPSAGPRHLPPPTEDRPHEFDRFQEPSTTSSPPPAVSEDDDEDEAAPDPGFDEGDTPPARGANPQLNPPVPPTINPIPTEDTN